MKKRFDFYKLMQMLLLCSFIGFWVENCFKLFKAGYVDNRFMFLPFLLGYGLAIVGIYFLFGTPREYFPLIKKEVSIKTPFNYFIYFLIMFVAVSVGEIALGYTVEKIGGFYYWDYTNLPHHFTRYTSLPTSLAFGAMITAFMGFCFEPIMRFFEKHMKSNGWKIATIVLVGAIVFDFLVSFGIMIYTGERNLIWRIHIFER